MELKSIIEIVSKEKNIKKEVVAQAISNALEKVMKKKYPYGRIEAVADDAFDFKIYLFKQVVDSEPEMLDEESEINLPEARLIDPNCQIGDEIGEEITAQLGRVDANIAKMAITEIIRTEESSIGYEQYLPLKGSIVSGTVQNSDRSGVLVNLGKVEAFIPRSELMPNDRLRRNNSVDALLKDISMDKGKLKITLSRTSPQFIEQLLKEEVPEIGTGEVEIVLTVREPGQKTKIVVDTDYNTVNPVSACIGSRGSRIQKVMQRVNGERIDVIAYTDDLTKFLENLLSGAKVRHVTETDKEVKAEILSEDFAKAIGKDGVNVRLASRILGRKVSVV